MSGSAGSYCPQGQEAQLLLPVVQAFMATALDIMHAQRGLLLRLQKGRILVEAQAHAGPDRVVADMQSFSPGQDDIALSLVKEVLRTCAPVTLEGAVPGGYRGADPFLHAHPGCAVVILPLSKRDGAAGMLYLERLGPGTRLTAEQMRFLELLAGQAAVSLETARLYAATTHEVIARREAEKALLESRAMLLHGERINQSGSWTCDVEQRVVNCSAEFCRIYERDPYVPFISFDALVALVHPCDREQVLRTLDEALAAQSTLRFDHRIIARDGAIRYLSVIGHPIRDTGLTTYAGTVTDVSCRRTHEHVQSRAQAELSRGARLATVGQMAAVIAHEVNQPLMAISANAGAAMIGIERASLNAGRFQQLLRDIVEQSQRAGAIIQTLQAMTHRRPQPEPVDLHMVIHQVLLAMRGEFDRHHIAVELDLRDQPLMVDADTPQLQQVLANLIGNAVDAMHETEGCVRLLKIASRRVDGDRVEVCVEDNGPGADAATYAQMFEPFVGTKPGGIGMGLAICRAIIEAHGGKILARGRRPHGCTVIFTIAGRAGIVSRDEAG